MHYILDSFQSSLSSFHLSLAVLIFCHVWKNKVFEKGVRKDMYAVEQDYYQTFISLFTSSWHKTIQKNKRIGRKVYQELIELQQSGELDEVVEMKLNELLEETKKWLDYYEWIERIIEFFDSGEVFKHVPK